MATTNVPLNDALAVKLWSKKLDHEALKFTEIAPLIGESANSVIHRKTELGKGPGDQLTFGIRMQLSGAGFTENQLAEGNGESLTLYHASLLINELGHVVGVKSKNTIDQQRIPWSLRSEARDGLSDWYAKRFSVAFFNQVCGNTLAVDVRYTGLNSVAAATRIIRQSGRASDDLLVAGDEFTLDLLDKAKEVATTSTPKMRPIRISGGGNGNDRRDFNSTLTDMYVVYLDPYQVTDIRSNTSSGQWQDLVKAAWQGAKGTGNPIFTGALGVYNNIIMRQAADLPFGISAAGARVDTVKRGVLLGGQAAMIAFAQDGGPTRFRWNEELYDHKRRLEVSAWTIHGLKKTVYNGVDYGVVVISTYAVAHT